MTVYMISNKIELAPFLLGWVSEWARGVPSLGGPKVERPCKSRKEKKAPQLQVLSSLP